MVFLYVLLVPVVAVLMELVAWFTHKYVMHGFLWVLHEDHHHPKGRGLQKNDLFAVFFALLCVLLFYAGTFLGWPAATAVAAGILLYGIGYFLFHDVMLHRRLPGVHIRANSPYLRRITRAHQMHHRRSGRKDGIAFGFLYASKEYAPRGERPAGAAR